MLGHVRKQADHHFDQSALVVDVFHANTHHQESDKLCNEYCNPALFPELIDHTQPKTPWVFNTSACEQVNVWFGAFQPMTREMHPERHVQILVLALLLNLILL